MTTEMIIHNARIATNGVPSFVDAIKIKDGRISLAGSNDEILRQRQEIPNVVDVKGRTVIPGLNDSHMHPIRGGLNFNMELRWDGVSSLADALRMLKEQAMRTPPPQWVRVVGGWTEFQFPERRMPTLDEINAAAPDTPVFILHLYAQALLNGAALRAVGYTTDTPDPPGGVGGRVVYAAGEFERLSPPALPVSPDWSPIKGYGGYKSATPTHVHARGQLRDQGHALGENTQHRVVGDSGLWSLGCDCAFG